MLCLRDSVSLVVEIASIAGARPQQRRAKSATDATPLRAAALEVDIDRRPLRVGLALVHRASLRSIYVSSIQQDRKAARASTKRVQRFT
jgi:hypothetical protein